MGPERAVARRLAEAVRAGARAVRGRPWQTLSLLAAAFVFASALRVVFAPFFQNMSMYGFRDWDSHSAYRYITVVALKRYHELPLWHPWFCGGFPGWAYVEGTTNLVSPYLPLYLVLPVQIAERWEVILSTLCAIGFTYLLAGRVTKSVALRALAAACYGLNGRWVMQFAEGHTWHLQYSWLPLAIYFFDVSLDRGKGRSALYAGMVLAMMAYMGGIYPLPHAALTLGLYAFVLTISRRSLRPLVSLAVAGVSSVGFAAPKLFPLLELMKRVPRKVDSAETLGLGQLLAVFTDPTGTVDRNPSVAVPSWGWMEYGIYVGVWVTGAMIVTVVSPPDRSDRDKGGAFRASGIFFLLLGLGVFHPYAPWTLLHKLPGFSSQHVPSRFLLTALLLLMIAFASLVGGRLRATLARRPWLDLLLLLPVYFVAKDMAAVDLESTKEIFMFAAPAIEPSPEFHHVTNLSYKYTPDWNQFGRQELLAMFANTGVLRCYGVPFPDFTTGAIAQEAPGYRGEAYLATGPGSAKITAWTPNTAVIHYEGATPGDTVVYNMNYDPGWRAGGGPAIDYKSAVAAPVTASSGDVKFHYYPPMLNWGLLAFVLTFAIGFWRPKAWRARAERSRHSALGPSL